MAEIRETRWRAVIEVEFVTRDYPVSEETTAWHVAGNAARGARGAERGPNVPRPQEVTIRTVGKASDDEA